VAAGAAGAAASALGGGLSGKVEFDEVLGAETLVYVATAAGRFIARVAPGTSHAPGTAVVLKPEAGALRMFDVANESALNAVAAPVV
jgi:hypothetical protein